MFNPSQQQVRDFFFTTYNKALDHKPLTSLEQLAHNVIKEHPEYLVVLANRGKYLDYNWSESEVNPFLHMSLHLTILEQLSIDQPKGIRRVYQQLQQKYHDTQLVEHRMIECLVDLLMTAQTHNKAPDLGVYFSNLTKLLEG